MKISHTIHIELVEDTETEMLDSASFEVSCNGKPTKDDGFVAPVPVSVGIPHILSAALNEVFKNRLVLTQPSCAAPCPFCYGSGVYEAPNGAEPVACPRHCVSKNTDSTP